MSVSREATARKLQRQNRGLRTKENVFVNHEELERQRLRQKQREENERAVHRINVIAATMLIMAFIASSAILFGILTLDSKVDKLHREVYELKSEIKGAQGEQTTLKMRIESMMSLKSVEEYAISLGMQKVSPQQTIRISINNGDEFVIAPPKEKGFFEKIGDSFASAFSFVGL